LGKKLRESFGGQITTSSKLHTRSKTGRDLYRVNVLYRPAKYKRGDVIAVRGDKVKLLQVGRRIFALDLKTRKKIKVRSEDLSQD
jgi:NMD protein affecting ribosome stability and mRNA decay